MAELEMPVFMRAGDGAEFEIGTVTLDARGGEATLSMVRRAMADFLRGAADHFEAADVAGAEPG